MSEGREPCCESCRHCLGAGCCRINLEKECGAGGFEAWEPKEPTRPRYKQTSDATVSIHDVVVTLEIPRHILDDALKEDHVRAVSGGGAKPKRYSVRDVQAAVERYYAKRIEWEKGKCMAKCRRLAALRDGAKRLEEIRR